MLLRPAGREQYYRLIWRECQSVAHTPPRQSHLVCRVPRLHWEQARWERARCQIKDASSGIPGCRGTEFFDSRPIVSHSVPSGPTNAALVMMGGQRPHKRTHILKAIRDMVTHGFQTKQAPVVNKQLKGDSPAYPTRHSRFPTCHSASPPSFPRRRESKPPSPVDYTT